MFRVLFNYQIHHIIVLSIILRLLYLLFFVDLRAENYFEYGDILTNLLNGKGYSLAYQIDDFENAYPSAYMPPGYVYFLFPFMMIKNVIIRNFLIYLIQIILSAIIIYLVYQFAERNFSRTSGLIAASIAAILPEFIYASISIGPTIIYHLGILLFLFYLYRIDLCRTTECFLIGGLLGGLIYFRTEVILFLLIVLVILIMHKKLTPALLILLTAVVILLPWQIRNYSVFGSFVPVSTSGGLNFYRGHNPYNIGDWGDSEVFNELKKYIGRKNYEMEMNRIYFERGFQTITLQPSKEIVNSFLKIFHLWIINPSDERTKHLLYIIPSLFLLMFAAAGIIKTFSWKKHKYSYLFLIYSTLVAVIFFALPRYQTMMKIMLIPFAAFGMEMLISSLQKKH